MRQSVDAESKPVEKASSNTKRVKILVGVVGVLAVIVAARMLWPERAPEPPVEAGMAAPATTGGAKPHRPYETPAESVPEGSGATHRAAPGR